VCHVTRVITAAQKGCLLPPPAAKLVLFVMEAQHSRRPPMVLAVSSAPLGHIVLKVAASRFLVRQVHLILFLASFSWIIAPHAQRAAIVTWPVSRALLVVALRASTVWQVRRKRRRRVIRSTRLIMVVNAPLDIIVRLAPV